MTGFSKPPAVFTCQECGDEFKLSHNMKTRRPKRKFCSRSCYNASQRNGEIRKCQNPKCDEVFYIQPARIRRGRGKYCSTPCRYEHEKRLLTRKHGTHAMYRSRGCRCAACKNAASKYRRGWKAKRKAGGG